MKLTSLIMAVFPFLFAQGENSNVETPKAEPEAQRAVLVTGASSGIGRRTAELLASRGFYVYAGARKDSDLEALSALENVEGIRLDVTIPAQIEAAVRTVRAGERGLYGLINNAGVAVLAPLIEVSEADLEFQMDVNVYGPYRVTKAFAPLLIESQGRVSTTGSISGVVTWRLGGPYTMSKHAIEAFSGVLAAELRPFGVQVSVVEPGNYRSDITRNYRERSEANGYTTEGSLYQNMMEQVLSGPADRERYKEPDEVAEAFFHALTSEDPKLHYMVVPNAHEAQLTIRAAISKVVELNRGQVHALDREALIKILDEELARHSK